MNANTERSFRKDQLSDIWPDAYIDWVEDWSSAYTKGRENLMACCGGESSGKTIIWPIERT